MDQKLKQRMIGAVILTVLAVIFVPMLFEEPAESPAVPVEELDLPEFPDDFESRVVPLATDADKAAQSVETETLEEVPLATVAPASESPAELEDGEGWEPMSTEEMKARAAETAARKPVTKYDPDAGKPRRPVLSSSRSAATPAPASATPSAAAGAGWFVQVGSFSQQKNALSLRDKLRSGGYTAFVESGASLYRVKIGPEADRKRAEAIRDQIAARFGLKGWISGAE